MTRICSYASWPSIRERNLHQATRRRIPSMSGRGEVILRVFALRARKSTTPRNFGGLYMDAIQTGGLVLTLGMSNIGAVLPELVICQRPALMYALHFSSYWGLKALGQREGRQGKILSSSMRGIEWLIACRGGKGVSDATRHMDCAYSNSSSRAASRDSSWTFKALANILAVATPSRGNGCNSSNTLSHTHPFLFLTIVILIASQLLPVPSPLLYSYITKHVSL
jgi:hypothetical protein